LRLYFPSLVFPCLSPIVTTRRAIARPCGRERGILRPPLSHRKYTEVDIPRTPYSAHKRRTAQERPARGYSSHFLQTFGNKSALRASSDCSECS
jgi:hypothetical protein